MRAKTIPALAGLILLGTAGGCSGEEKEPPAREPAVAGTFYPADPAELRRELDAQLSAAPVSAQSGRLLGVVVPHASYHYSGAVAAAAFRQLQGRQVGPVYLVGCSHRAGFPGVSIPDFSLWRTPLGEVEADLEAARRLRDSVPGAGTFNPAHLAEHSLEVELPLLQVAAPGAKIVPILIGAARPETVAALGEALGERLRDEPESLIVCSADLVHYPSRAQAERIDPATLEAVASLDTRRLEEHCAAELRAGVPNLSCVICAREAVSATMAAVRAAGAVRGTVLARSTSAAAAPHDAARVVGYGAVAFYQAAEPPAEEKPMPENNILSPPARARLLAIAREALSAAVRGLPAPAEPVADPELQGRQGAFVTLNRRGSLRGCIGQFTAEEPLYRVVRRMAAQSSLHDPRFPPVAPAELPEIEIEISVLSPMRRVSDPEREVEVGKHGIYIRRGGRSGTYLPQVATDHNMSREEFLSSCAAHKAGLSPDAWKDPATEVYVYTAEVFGEGETGTP